jgi:glyoxylase-like metal-dependent hydrolase (beta-lactamase superfamily II)
MKELADAVWMLDGFPREMLNVYVIGDVLIDSGTRFDARRIRRQIAGRTVSAHALTHAHPDHLGSSHQLCRELGVPFWVGDRDVPAAEDPATMARAVFPLSIPGGNTLVRAFLSTQAGPGHPVDRALKEGDEVGGFTVLDVPGHSAGHVAFWRASDRVLVCGDVMWNFHFTGGRPGLTQPLPAVSPDPALNRASARRLAALDAELICFGHGPPMRDPAAFADAVARLPDP